eukprot:535098_1
MQPTNPSSNELFVRLLKEQSNRLNCQCQQFQTEIRSFISATMDDSSIDDKLSKVLDNYSTSLNKICVEYLIKLESQISHVPSTPQSVNPNASTRPYSCQLCDVSYTAKSSLRRHTGTIIHNSQVMMVISFAPIQTLNNLHCLASNSNALFVANVLRMQQV